MYSKLTGSNCRNFPKYLPAFNLIEHWLQFSFGLWKLNNSLCLNLYYKSWGRGKKIRQNTSRMLYRVMFSKLCTKCNMDVNFGDDCFLCDILHLHLKKALWTSIRESWSVAAILLHVQIRLLNKYVALPFYCYICRFFNEPVLLCVYQ